MNRLAFLLCGMLVASAAAVALAAGPPRVLETSSYEIHATSARVSAKYENHMKSTHAVLQLSRSSSMSGLWVAKESTEYGSSVPTNVRFVLAGLSPATAYWYRIVVTTAEGTASSAVGQLHTTAGDTLKPTASYDGYTVYSPDRIIVSATGNGRGLPSTMKMSWSYAPDMRSPTVFFTGSSRGVVGPVAHHPIFDYAKFRDRVQLYFQVEVTTANGTARTGSHGFVVIHTSRR